MLCLRTLRPWVRKPPLRHDDMLPHAAERSGADLMYVQGCASAAPIPTDRASGKRGGTLTSDKHPGKPR
jgi:hypothetical protein